jgi:exopolysaccharide production negative regulator
MRSEAGGLWLGGRRNLETIMSAGMVNMGRWRNARMRRLARCAMSLAAAIAVWTGSAAAQQVAASASAQAAIERGLAAYQAGSREAAIAALSEAASRGDASARFAAEFYLARIYAENIAVGADQTKAFVLFRKLADENLNVDPETSKRAPFIAKALIALAGYVRTGLGDIDLAPNPGRAVDYLHHAAVFFGDHDAQFELARIYLGGDASADDVRRGLHYLAALTEESHAPAQALLAELFWRGRHVKKDERRALALVSIAAENAPSHERIWIDDTYATIYCATTESTREQAERLVARWRRMFAQPAAGPDADVRGAAGAARGLVPERQCASGERVAVGPVLKFAPPVSAPAQPAGGGLMRPVTPATAGSTGYRAAGFVESVAKK